MKDNKDTENTINNIVWIVTYYDKGEEPVVTPFGNKEAAEACYNYFKLQHDGCCLDECDVYNKFFDGEKWVGSVE